MFALYQQNARSRLHHAHTRATAPSRATRAMPAMMNELRRSIYASLRLPRLSSVDIEHRASLRAAAQTTQRAYRSYACRALAIFALRGITWRARWRT